MQSIFPYHSNNFSALLQEIKLNNSFSVENQYVPWHTRRKFTVQNYRILYDKAISTTTTNCTNEDITTISKRFTGITCTAYNHLRICVHTSSAIPHLLRPWISWDENKKSVVLNIALTIFLHFSSFLFLRCDMKTASDANLYRGSWPFPSFSFQEFQVQVNPHTSSSLLQSSIAFCCISHCRHIQERIVQGAHFLMVPRQFFVLSGIWSSQLYNQNTKCKWVSIQFKSRSDSLVKHYT